MVWPFKRKERLTEAAGTLGAPAMDEEAGWRRAGARAAAEGRDLQPLAHERMQKLAEWLWQSNLLANRLIELPLAYLLAEGVTLQCVDDEHQRLLNAFWSDAINNWPGKIEQRCRALALLGEQCYVAHVRAGDGFVRLGYLDPRSIDAVVCDPENPEQPIGIITQPDEQGRVWRYRIALLGEDADLLGSRAQELRRSFADGEALLYQINKAPCGTRGRSDLLAHIDWLDAYDSFLFNEIDRIDYLRRFVWDVTLTGADAKAVGDFRASFAAPDANSVFVHNEQVQLQARTSGLGAQDTSDTARMLRNHVLGGATVPEHWFGGGGDVNRAAASEMGEPAFKVYTLRQGVLQRMLEEIGRYVLLQAARARGVQPDWADDRWQVTAVFPELASRDVTKFASSLAQLTTSCIQLIDAGLLTQESALKIIADVAQRFGQDFDAKQELEAAQAERAEREAAAAAADTFPGGAL